MRWTLLRHKIALENPSKTQWRSARDNNILTCCKETITSFVECKVLKPSFQKPRSSQTLVVCLFVAGTWMHAGYHLTTAIAGPSLLSLPYAFSFLGWAPGLLALTICGLVSSYAYCLLSQVLDDCASKGHRFYRFRELSQFVIGTIFYYHHLVNPFIKASISSFLHHSFNSFLAASKLQFLPPSQFQFLLSSIRASIPPFLHQCFISFLPSSIICFLSCFCKCLRFLGFKD
jgi:hypothetical protein